MIQLYTDSTCCLPRRDASELGVQIVPISCSVKGRTFLEEYLEESGEFETMMADHPSDISTSHPPISTFSAMFQPIEQRGGEALCLVLSSRLSGTYSSASIAAQVSPSGRIRVLDSLTTAGGLHLLLRAAKEKLDEGMSLSDLSEYLLEKRGHVGIAFSVGDMAALRRSGRLGVVRQSVGTMLNVRPILTLEDGAIKACGITRGTAQTLRALAERIPSQAKAIIVHYQGAMNDPMALVASLRARFPGADIRVGRISCALRVHLGNDCNGAAWMR